MSATERKKERASAKGRMPLYKIIETELLEKIDGDVYKVGSGIPTENELAKLYNTSRVTVRQATNDLVAKGILVRSQGSGTFVAKKPSVLERAIRIVGFREEMERAGRTPSTDILTFEVVTADTDVADKLQIGVGERVYHVVRLRRADGSPMALENSWMSVDKYPDLTWEVLQKSKYDYIEKVRGLAIDFCRHVVLPVLPDPADAELLEVDAREPLLLVRNTTWLKDGSILDYTELLLNSPSYQYIAIKSR